MTRKIKPRDLFPMDRKVEREEILAVKRVMRDKRLTFMSGTEIEEFETAFANYMGAKYAIAVSSGTAALHVSLAAAGIGAGDEVLIPPYTFVATATAVLHQNAIPVFVDIDPNTFCMDPTDLKNKVTDQTKAIIPVHLFGYPMDLTSLLEFAEKHNLVLIEDACQAHGAEYDGKKIGTFGKAGCFSLFESKNMMTGEGGIIVTDDPEFAEQCRLVRHHGEPSWYTYERLGYNYRMTTIQAAIGLEQLKKLDQMNDGRIKNSLYLNSLLKDIPGVALPQMPENGKHVFHAYALQIDPSIVGMTGKELADRLNRDFQITQLIYPAGLYTSTLFKERMGYGNRKCPFTCPFFEQEVFYTDSRCPITDKITENVIGLPNWHQLSYIELSLIAGKFLREMEEILNTKLGIKERIIGTMLSTRTSPKVYELISGIPKVDNPLKIGVIGLGGIGQVHAAAYSACSWTELHSFATRNPVSLQGAALFFGVTNIYEDYLEALNDPQLQAVSICVPTFVHKEYIVAAANAGKHILCEKPILLHPEELKAVEHELKKNNVKLMVAMICRFMSHYSTTKRVIDKGEIGSIVSIHAHRRGRGPPVADWFWNIDKSGGIAVDLAIHDIDLVQWFLGPNDPIKTVYAIGSNSVYPEIDTWDTVVITLQSQSGVLITIEASWAEADLRDQVGNNTKMFVYGEDGTIQIDPSKQPAVKNTELDGLEPTLEEFDQLPFFVDQVGAFAKAILNDEEVPIPISDGISALRVARAALESLQSGDVIHL
ncbi:MAG: aminotransferase class I/II-fold pyridoxal phosphate-dependent enzyme [Candidatus Heimdallarchaeota archaeon]|nr:MAG: aminotransferase class I/II-fold pyridoxal phosphate-dependent enzyme [Candidatus Heimdallarchaeota archaeon]